MTRENPEMRLARASKKAYRAQKEFEAELEKIQETVDEADTEHLADEIRKLASDEDEPA